MARKRRNEKNKGNKCDKAREGYPDKEAKRQMAKKRKKHLFSYFFSLFNAKHGKLTELNGKWQIRRKIRNKQMEKKEKRRKRKGKE